MIITWGEERSIHINGEGGPIGWVVLMHEGGTVLVRQSGGDVAGPIFEEGCDAFLGLYTLKGTQGSAWGWHHHLLGLLVPALESVSLDLDRGQGHGGLVTLCEAKAYMVIVKSNNLGSLLHSPDGRYPDQEVRSHHASYKDRSLD